MSVRQVFVIGLAITCRVPELELHGGAVDHATDGQAVEHRRGVGVLERLACEPDEDARLADVAVADDDQLDQSHLRQVFFVVVACYLPVLVGFD